MNYLPDLSPSNNYDNDYNRGIVNDIVLAGFNTLALTGFTPYPTNAANVNTIKNVINLFYEYGIKTLVYAGNHHNEVNATYEDVSEFPDFSDCDGFLGFYAWDEATTAEQFSALVDYAEMFKTVYGTSSDYMYFNDVGYAYLDEYCEQVLANLPEGVEKYLSTYSYPIKTDHTLGAYFLSNLVTLKLLSLEYGAKSTVMLQSSTWDDAVGLPTLNELRLQVYAALAFGIDDLSFFTYSTLTGNDDGTAPVDANGCHNDAYDNLKTVLTEVNALDEVLQWFKWQGVILNVESGSDDEVSYNNAINGYRPIISGKSTDVGSVGLGDYLLEASDTVLLSNVTNGAYAHNFILGVFVDNNGNEGYMLSNYNDLTKTRSQKVTLTFSQNVTKVYIYRQGVKNEVNVVNNTLDVTLSNGEGVFILPSQIG